MSEGQTFQWATSLDAFANVATATQAQVFITANYGTGTPQEAAAWVRYANKTKHYDFKYWEIGNENYGTWEVDNNARPHDPVTYATRFKEYFQQMKAVDRSIKIGAVVVADEDSFANYTDESAVEPAHRRDPQRLERGDARDVQAARSHSRLRDLPSLRTGTGRRERRVPAQLGADLGERRRQRSARC